MEWLAGGGLAGLFTAATFLVWRLIRLSTEQQEALLAPAYERIRALEKRLRSVEADNRTCQAQLAYALRTLRYHNLEPDAP